MRIFVLFIGIYVVLQNFSYAAVQAWLLSRMRPRPAWLIGVSYTWAALMSGLFLVNLLQPVSWKPFLRESLYFPLSVQMSWNLLLLQILFPAALLAVIIARRRRTDPVPATVSPKTTAGVSRRRFLYLLTYGAAPATAIGMGVHGASTREDLRVREFHVPIANLPPELEGFTIAHVSDLHSGIFVGPDRLRQVSNATNDLKADLIALTGDLINGGMDEFPAALAAMQRLESPYGLYICEGNHDVGAGSGLVARSCMENGLTFLWDRSMAVPVRGQRLLIGGTCWESNNRFMGDPRLVGTLYPPRQPGDVRILLAHHPHLFDVAQDTDLVLSGHTHGGQIMIGDVGLGRIRFKYCSGRFQRGDTTLIVSNGCGDWFPCRIGAPAEIGLLTLTAARA